MGRLSKVGSSHRIWWGHANTSLHSPNSCISILYWAPSVAAKKEARIHWPQWNQAHSDQQLSSHAATDDRCANFSASTCPTQNLKLTASSTADKLPLEKFHRLLDLAFWGKFLKLHTISCFVFLWDVYRVSLDPVIFRLAGLRRSYNAAGGTCHA
jgi:hypothetical protein